MTKPMFHTRESSVNFIIPDLDLNDPDEAEIKLLEMAHALAVGTQDASEAAIGRILKTFIPGLCEVLRHENGRDTLKADILNGMVNSFSLLLSIVMLGCIKPGREEVAAKTITAAMAEAIKLHYTNNLQRQAEAKNA